MRSLKTIGATILLLSVFCSCKEKKQKVTNEPDKAPAEQQIKETKVASFSNELATELFENYQRLRLALIATDAAEAQAIAAKMEMGLTDDQEDLKTIALAMANEGDVEEQRMLFSSFTAKTEPLFTELLTEGKLYKQFCPMAFEGQGGYWISDREEIRNPYFGDKMLTCGKVVEVIQ